MKTRAFVFLLIVLCIVAGAMGQNAAPSDLQKQKPDNYYRKQLFDAIKKADLPQVASLVKAHPELTKLSDEDGANVLFPAIVAGNGEILEFLIIHHADVNCAAKVDQLTPLHAAAAYKGGDPVLTKILLMHGASPNPKARVEIGNMGQGGSLEARNITPLMLAVIVSDNPEVVAELLNHGADPYLKSFDEDGTALEWATMCDEMAQENADHNRRTKVIAVLREWMKAHPKK